MYVKKIEVKKTINFFLQRKEVKNILFAKNKRQFLCEEIKKLIKIAVLKHNIIIITIINSLKYNLPFWLQREGVNPLLISLMID